MKRLLGSALLLIVALTFVLPESLEAQPRSVDHGRYNVVSYQPQWQQYERRRWRRERRRNHRWRDTYGYRNYGQYRRTQVGNRRFRLTRQYYYRNGLRLSRWVRIYY